MNDDKMRAEFEKWAKEQCLSLTRINWIDGTVSDYAYTATFDAWQVWQAAYAAGMEVAIKQLKAELRVLKFGRTSRKQRDTTPPTT